MEPLGENSRKLFCNKLPIRMFCHGKHTNIILKLRRHAPSKSRRLYPQRTDRMLLRFKFSKYPYTMQFLPLNAKQDISSRESN